MEGERLRAMADAVHEATHVFDWRERPLCDLNTALDLDRNPLWWWWMHEAMALYMETVVLRDNDDFHRFVRHWVVLPEIPLDAWHPGYQAGLFLCYLSDRLGPEIINRIWTPSDPAEKPLQALERVLQEKGVKFSSPNPDDDDVFASGYCMDSYFLKDACHARNVFERHGERAISASHQLSLGESPPSEDTLDHLACRYYRFFLERRIAKLQVRLLTAGRESGTNLKAELAIVTKQMQRGSTYKLRSSIRPMAIEEPIELFAEISEIPHGDIDHVVLVVSNCAFRGMDSNSRTDHYDGQQYTVNVTAR
jgi:hypothetical protein